MRQSQIIMGTGVSVDIPDASEAVFEKVFARLRAIDAQFSPYKKNNELARFRQGQVAGDELSLEMRQVIKACKKAEEETDGYFVVGNAKNFDPSGYVKGWAIAEAGKLIKINGHHIFCIGIGGDILAASDGKKTWKIGIQNPQSKKYLTSQVFLQNGAIATSGNYERGQHIINPKTGKLADELLSFSVIGPDIIMADVLATAGFAAGKDWQTFLSKHPTYQGMSINKEGRAQTTKNWQPNHSPESNRT